jgi:hypothetical protein
VKDYYTGKYDIEPALEESEIYALMNLVEPWEDAYVDFLYDIRDGSSTVSWKEEGEVDSSVGEKKDEFIMWLVIQLTEPPEGVNAGHVVNGKSSVVEYYSTLEETPRVKVTANQVYKARETSRTSFSWIKEDLHSHL